VVSVRRYRRYEPDLDLAMARAFLPLLVLLGLTAAHTVAAAPGSARQGDRAVTNTFMLVTAAPPAHPAPRSAPSNGVGIGPGKPVVSNPYQVPLLQNAGPLRGAR
jgi:hypothetical protein